MHHSLRRMNRRINPLSSFHNFELNWDPKVKGLSMILTKLRHEFCYIFTESKVASICLLLNGLESDQIRVDQVRCMRLLRSQVPLSGGGCVLAGAPTLKLVWEWSKCFQREWDCTWLIAMRSVYIVSSARLRPLMAINVHQVIAEKRLKCRPLRYALASWPLGDDGDNVGCLLLSLAQRLRGRNSSAIGL
jgi:hypothetical protein